MELSARKVVGVGQVVAVLLWLMSVGSEAVSLGLSLCSVLGQKPAAAV